MSRGTRRLCILCDPLAHHSSLLPFRELTRRAPTGFSDDRFSRFRTLMGQGRVIKCILPDLSKEFLEYCILQKITSNVTNSVVALQIQPQTKFMLLGTA